MYAPKYYQTDEATLKTIIIENNFGSLVTIASNLEDVKCVRAPFLLDEQQNKLFCHVAAENTIWKNIQSISGGAPVACVFDGPHHYISPLWYKSVQENPASRVPTWHHASVLVKGKAKIVVDTDIKVGFLKGLSHFHEATFAKEGQEWNLQYMSNEKLFKMIERIAVIEIDITSLEGTLKMGQSGSLADRESAAEALTKIGSDQALATAFLTKTCEQTQPMRGLQEHMENLAKQRATKRENVEKLAWKDICVGVFLVGVPLLAYRLFLARK